METHTKSVAGHYGGEDIRNRIRTAIEAAGLDPAKITIDDLAQMDEVHTRGREATAEIASLTEFTPDLHVIDVGCGVGGPARFLASQFGCRVTGVDLTAAFIDAANYLTDLTGLTNQVSFECASALDMPFEPASFDLAWTVQMQMNIADKTALYGEIHRVLKPGGRLVFQDIVKGPDAEIILPVPWASEQQHSHLVPPDDLRKHILDAGFKEVVWRDTTDAQKAWSRAQAEKPPGEKPLLGIDLVLGPDAKTKRINSGRSLMAGAIGFVQGVFEKA